MALPVCLLMPLLVLLLKDSVKNSYAGCSALFSLSAQLTNLKFEQPTYVVDVSYNAMKSGFLMCLISIIDSYIRLVFLLFWFLFFLFFCIFLDLNQNPLINVVNVQE